MNIGIICLIVIGLLAIVYLFLIFPRIVGRPDSSYLHGVHYAHRGLFDNESEAPENSLPAFRKAVEAGYGIELDVQLSKDGELVVFHDETLKRMCGVDGKVWEYTLEELQTMKLAGSKETIPTFESVLEAVGGKVPLIVEYKFDRVDYRVCEKGNEALKPYDGTYCIESFHPFVVRWYRKHRPDIVRGQLSQDMLKVKNEKYPRWMMFCMTYLLVNVLGRPDFVAYCHEDANNISRRICTLLGAIPVTWTIQSREQYEKAKRQFKLFIFDGFRL